MKRILITGITGYIGSRLAHWLLPDCEVYGLVREPLNLRYIEDIQDRIQLLKYDGSYGSMSVALRTSRPDLIYHLAAYYTGNRGPEHVLPLISSNITMGAYLLDAMADCGCGALIYASTIMSHYQGVGYRPLNLYAATKRAFSDMVEYYTSTGLINAVSVTLSDTYGPGDCRPKVLNLIRQAILDEMPIDLTSGTQVFDVTYIDDVVRALVMANDLLQNAPHQFFQLGSEDPRTLRDTVELLLRVNGLSFRPNWGSRPDPERQIEGKLDIYPTPPDWRPEISLEEGLRRFWAFR